MARRYPPMRSHPLTEEEAERARKAGRDLTEEEMEKLLPKPAKETMTFEEFKKKLEENLLEVTRNAESTRKTMKVYEDDLPEFFQEGWSIAGITPAMIWRFI